MKFYLKIVLGLFSFLLVVSCSINKEPEYQHMEDLKVAEFNRNQVVLTSDLVYYNPNSVGAKVEANTLRLFYGGKKVADVQAKEFKAKAKNIFKVPIEIRIPTKEFLKESSWDMVKGLLNTAVGRKETFDLEIKGDLTLSVAGIKFKKRIDETQKVEF